MSIYHQRVAYELCRRCNANVVTEASIVAEFTGDRVYEILWRTLHMDRANCLYKMTYHGHDRPGMHWVSKVHLTDTPDRNVWASRLAEFDAVPPMNKKLIQLMEMKGLGLYKIPQFVGWTSPALTDFGASSKSDSKMDSKMESKT